MISPHFQWTEKYRPEKVADCILPDNIKSKFQAYVKAREMPNIICTGGPGVGKTSVILATLNEMGVDYIHINAALKRGMDTIRDEALNFASTVSFAGGRKYIIFDEADGILNAAQEALKAFVEGFAENCGFIFNCNSLPKIIKEIQDRCVVIDFHVSEAEINELSGEFFKRVGDILISEGITYNPKVVKTVIMKFRPSWRKILIVLQDYAIQHKQIDSGILTRSKVESVEPVVALLKSKNFKDLRKWVGENASVVSDFTVFANDLFTLLESQVDIVSLPLLSLAINEFDFRSYFCNDKETNTVAFLVNVMRDMTWK